MTSKSENVYKLVFEIYIIALRDINPEMKP